MASYALQMFVAAFVALTAVRVSAQTHHVLGGDAASDVGSWLSGRVFRVGDKISFGTEDSIVEVEGPEEFGSCDLANPIKMYTDRVAHVELEKEGTRYFASANPESCKNGLKLPVSVHSHEYGPYPPTEYGPPPHHHSQPPPEYAQPPPHHHSQPPPEYAQPPPEYAQPPPHHSQPPPEYAQPPPHHSQPPPEHAQPPPEFGPPPSAANYLNGLSFAVIAGLLVCSIGM